MTLARLIFFSMKNKNKILEIIIMTFIKIKNNLLKKLLILIIIGKLKFKILII